MRKRKSKRVREKLLEEMPEDARKEFEKETFQGNPENLVKPDNKDE